MNNVIVITGGGGVLCSCFAKELAKTGAPVAILDINYEKVEEVAKQIRDEGGIAKAYCANVLDRDSLEKIREAGVEELMSVKGISKENAYGLQLQMQQFNYFSHNHSPPSNSSLSNSSLTPETGHIPHSSPNTASSHLPA